VSTSVRRLLYSENRYMRWKAASCPPFERPPHSTEDKAILQPLAGNYRPSWATESAEGRHNIPRYLGKADECRRVLDDNPREYEFGCLDDLEAAKEYARLLAEDTPAFKSFVQVPAPI
jgi:THO complex subunit 1 transcription elongation factor